MTTKPDESVSEKDVDSIQLNGDGEPYDEDTGEVLDNPSSEGFLKLFDGGLWKLKNIGNAKLRLLIYLIENMNRKNNICKCTQNDLAEALDISQNYVSQILNEMEIIGLIYMGRGFYQVSPDFVWFGKEPGRKKAYAIYQKRKHKKLNEPL